MLLVVSDDEGQDGCCFLWQIIKARVSIVCVSDYDGQGGCCLLCQIMMVRAGVVCCVR